MFSSLLTLALLGTQALALPADFDASPELDARAVRFFLLRYFYLVLYLVL